MGGVDCSACRNVKEHEFLFPDFPRSEKKNGENIDGIIENSIGPDIMSNLMNENIKFFGKTAINLSNEMKEAKSNLENKLKEDGAIISSNPAEMNRILKDKNPLALQVELSPEKVRQITKGEELFFLPVVKFPNNEFYEGSWNSEGKKHGYGVKIKQDGTIYKGIWDNDKEGEYGALFYKNGYYIGDIKDGKPDGEGEFIVPAKFKYNGPFVDGKPYGNGILENFKDKYIYDGPFADFKMNGIGKLTFENGDTYEGNLKDDKMDGHGVYRYKDGKIYEGEFTNGYKNGKGKMTWNENQYYDGDWVNDYQHGMGKYYLNGKIIAGKFRYGKIIKKDDE